MTRSPQRGRASSGGRASYVPDRGDLVWLDFNPQKGREQAGRRPALVLSPAAYNGKVGLALFCPITNQAKGYPYEVLIPKGFKAAGVVLADQVKSFDWRLRNVERIDRVPDAVVTEVVENALTLLKPEDGEGDAG
jgi:mRNA interferase MazF